MHCSNYRCSSSKTNDKKSFSSSSKTCIISSCCWRSNPPKDSEFFLSCYRPVALHEISAHFGVPARDVRRVATTTVVAQQQLALKTARASTRHKYRRNIVSSVNTSVKPPSGTPTLDPKSRKRSKATIGLVRGQRNSFIMCEIKNL